MSGSVESEVESLVQAFYAAFDSRDGRKVAVAALRKMFAPHARIMRVAAGNVEAWTPNRFIGPRAKMLSDGTLVQFREWEIAGDTVVVGDMASRRSRYGKAGRLDGQDYRGGGNKLFHFVRVGGRWRIAFILWEDISTEGPPQ